MSTVREQPLYSGYIRNIRQYYEREPLFQASLQLILSIFAVAFFSFAAIRPTLGTITTLLKKIDDQKKADQQLSTKIVQLANAQEFLSVNGEEVTSLANTAVPDNPDIKRLALMFELSANQAGAVVTGLYFQAIPLVGTKSSLTESSNLPVVKGKNGEQFVTFNFTAGGNQVQLVDFLDRLEHVGREITLTDLVFSKPQTTGKLSYSLVVSGKATAYYLPGSN